MTGPGVAAVPGWAPALVWLILALTAAWAAVMAAKAACHWRQRHRKLRLQPGDCVRCVSHHPAFQCLCEEHCGTDGCWAFPGLVNPEFERELARMTTQLRADIDEGLSHD